MSQFAKSKIAIILGGVLVAPLYVNAAPQPNAGTLLDSVREKDMAQPRKADPGINIQQEAPPAKRAQGGAKVKIKSFNITGATVFSQSELQAVIATWVGKESTLSDLERAASEISRHYRDRGYFVARAYLPAQDVTGGVVNIAVLEGQVGGIKVNLKGDGRLSKEVVRDVVDASVPKGTVVSEAHLERGLLLANDLAGVKITSTLVPGATVGTSDIMIDAEQTGTVNGNVDIDNFGNRFTGEYRVGATLNINNPAGVGDQVSGRIMTSGNGMTFGRLSYLLPIGDDGTKAGLAYSAMRYRLGRDFAPLNATGTADTLSIYAMHPIARSRNNNLYVTAAYDHKNMENKAGAGIVSDNTDNVFSFGINGDSRDGMLGGGITSYGAVIAKGDIDLSAVPANLIVDTIGAQTHGDYTKINYNVARLQRVADGLAVFAAGSGQTASRNLDSSAKFSLGGANGVRAYPQGEALGDEGFLLNLELRKNMGNSGYGDMQLIGFVDVGHTQLNKTLWAGWQGTNLNLPNTYELAGAGVGFNIDQTDNYSFRSYLAAKIGANEGHDAFGKDSDGTDSSARLWMQFVKWF